MSSPEKIIVNKMEGTCFFNLTSFSQLLIHRRINLNINSIENILVSMDKKI